MTHLDLGLGVPPDGFLPAYVALLSLGTLIAMVHDKRQAGKGRRRVSERTLVTLGAIGGGPGGLAACYLLRHKTRTPRVLWPFWITGLFWAAVLLWVAAPHLL